MNLTNINKRIAFTVNNNIWNHIEVLVDERVSWSRTLRKIDTMFNDISVSVVDTVLPKWFFQFYRLY
jgi:hypothetical protein